MKNIHGIIVYKIAYSNQFNLKILSNYLLYFFTYFLEQSNKKLTIFPLSMYLLDTEDPENYIELLDLELINILDLDYKHIYKILEEYSPKNKIL